MARVRVPVANTVGKTVRINPDATIGATIGTDLRLPDGTVPSLAQLAAALASEAVAVEQVRSFRQLIDSIAPSQVPVGAVTQHQAALSIAETQIPDGSILARVGGNESVTGDWVFSGLLTVPEATVTAHEAALTIALSNFDDDLDHIIEVAGELQLDQADITVTSNGTVITFSVEKEGGGDIRILFSDGVFTHDTDPTPDTIALTPGAADTTPQINYVYILQSTKALTVSTAGWPATEHSRYAVIFCQTAASLQTDGAYKMHAWTDHTDSAIAHHGYWVRSQPATWKSGTLATTSVGAATFDIAVAAGVIQQMHDHAYPAFNTATGSEVMIVNQFGTAYDRVGNMVSQITDANNVSMSGKYYNLVVWGVVSEDSGDCQLMVNLPTASYNNSSAAVLDASATSVYDIPSDFIGTGFLIARLVVRHQVGGNTYSISSNVDLRGKKPSTSAGGTVGGGVTALGDLSDVDPTGHSDNDLMYWAAGVLIDTAGALTFDGTDLVCGGDLSGVTIGGITEANLLDKTATEAVTGDYTFSHADGIRVANSAPLIWLEETDAAANQGKFRFLVWNEDFFMQLIDDAEAASTTFLSVTRTSQTANVLTLSATSVDVIGALTATSYGGITEANLVDKTANETIAADWLFASGLSAQGGVSDTGQVAEFAFMDVSGTTARFGAYSWDLAAWADAELHGKDVEIIGASSITLNSPGATNVIGALTAGTYGGITEANLVDKTANEEINGNWNFQTVAAPSLTITSSAGTVQRFVTGRDFTVNRNWQIGTDYLAEGTFDIIPSTILGGSTYSTPLVRLIGSTPSVAITGALTATSYGGITEANLLDKTADEAVTGQWSNTLGWNSDYTSEGSAYGATIFGMGLAFNGGVSGVDSTLTSLYGMKWMRATHTNIDSQILEGVYVAVGGTIRGAIGTEGIHTVGSVFMDEKAGAAGSVAGRGQLWIKNTAPAQLWFTDDAGTDTQIV